MSKSGVRIHRLPIQYEQIVFEDTHKYCLKLMKNKKPCPSYNKNWSCPPISPTHIQMAKKLSRYKQFLVIIYEFDLLNWKEHLRQDHPEWNEQKLEQNAFNSHLYNGKIYWGLRNLLKPFLKSSNTYVLGNSNCRRCRKCAKKTGEPCRHPKERIFSMESSGINVDASLRNIGYELLWDGKIKVCQVALICFREINPLITQTADVEVGYEMDVMERELEIVKELIW